MNKSKFTFSDPALLKFQFEINEDFITEDGKNYNIEQNFHIEINPNPEKENCAVVILSLELGTNVPDCPFFLSMIEGANFRWEKDSYTKEQQEKLLTQNAPALLLSYMRPLVASVTSASPYPAYHLPFIDFTSTSQDNSSPS